MASESDTLLLKKLRELSGSDSTPRPPRAAPMAKTAWGLSRFVETSSNNSFLAGPNSSWAKLLQRPVDPRMNKHPLRTYSKSTSSPLYIPSTRFFRTKRAIAFSSTLATLPKRPNVNIANGSNNKLNLSWIFEYSNFKVFFFVYIFNETWNYFAIIIPESGPRTSAHV